MGLVTATLGLGAFGVVVWLWFLDRGPTYGWGWVMATLLVFSGTRIRSYGFLGNRHRAAKLARCRQLLGTTTSIMMPARRLSRRSS